ncbi:MAG: trypsin-like peptidase domain-containing protein [Lachnoclostridium sp.]|nr:trypsin-like peptidase domain-containing protein [Lachnospira sp.]MCM1247763.1 trypsin-like peptidase domain-containing protein [Lachnoclostridium sp.]
MYENEIYGGSTMPNSSMQQFSTANTQTANPQFANPQFAPASQPVQDRNADRKGGGFFRKLILSISLGLFFGIFAGVGFFAAQQGMQLAEKESGTSEVKEVETLNRDDNKNSDLNYASDGQALQVSPTYVVSSDVSDVVEEMMPAMVSIINNYTETSSFWGRNYSQDYEASGSGIIVGKNETELLMVSNHHVVSDANTLKVTFIDGEEAVAYIKGTDKDMDLAVIAVPLSDLREETLNAIHIAKLGDSDSLKLGEPVIAIGNALGYGQSVTNGIVSALDREVKFSDGSKGTFIQTNAAINPGNSGGALVNINGEVIGINCSKYMDVEVEGMGYAIPITTANPVLADLIERQQRQKVADKDKGYLGIEYEEMNSQYSAMFNIPQGIYVKSVERNSAADKAGLKQGDIITKMDNESIVTKEDLQKNIQYYAVGDTVVLTVMRPEDGEYVSLEIEAVLGKRP